MSSPVAATYIFLPEPGPNTDPQVPIDEIPESWKKYRYDAMDILYVSPFVVVDSSGTFALGTAPGSKSLQKRFEWLVANARAANPKIRLIAEMPTINGDEQRSDYNDWRVVQTPDQINTFAFSMMNFMRTWYNKTLVADNKMTVNARINGFDADYEEDSAVDNVKAILKPIKFWFTDKMFSPPLQLSLTPDAAYAALNNLDPGTLDFVNMQRYDGGSSNHGGNYLDGIPGLKPEQLVYGLSAEMPWKCDPSYDVNSFPKGMLDQVFQQYEEDKSKNQAGGGLFIWRINSNNDCFENMMQVTIYNRVHGPKLKQPDYSGLVAPGWDHNGGKEGPREGSLKPVAPWNDWSWSEK